MLGTRLTAWFRDMSLSRKILIPYLVLVLAVGASGAAILVHEAASRAQQAADQRLSQALLDGRAVVQDSALYTLESANFAANEVGMASAVAHGRRHRVTTLLQSVRALKAKLDLLLVLDRGEHVVSGFRRGAATRLAIRSGVVSAVLADPNGHPRPALLTVGGGRYLAAVSAICLHVSPCHAVGVSVAGVSLTSVVRGAASAGADGLTLGSARGATLAGTRAVPAGQNIPTSGDLLRVRGPIGGHEDETLYGPLILNNQRLGTLAATVPVASTFVSIRRAALRFGLVIVLAMLAVVGIGVLLSRAILKQVRALVRTNRALGAGDLTARAPVVGRDEIGELAVGVNEMAYRLEAAMAAAESRAEQSADEVQRLLRARTEFFAGLSHEFRTPLAVIRAQADLLMDKLRTADVAARRELEAMKAAAGEALDLVNDVLEATKAESGRVELNLEAIELSEVLAGVQPILDGLTSAAGQSLVVDAPSSLPVVAADRRRLREVLLNLVDNAAKYTPDRGTVAIRAREIAQYVEVEVSDTGVGIPEDGLSHVFEPFYRVPGIATQRGQASSGLGLALTRQLVKAMGGSIDVESELGRGTTFRFTLPILEFVQLPHQPTGSDRREVRAKR